MAVAAFFAVTLIPQMNAKSDTVRTYQLRTDGTSTGMAYFGVGAGIDGQQNPVLQATAGDTVEIVLSSGDGDEHNIIVPDFKAESAKGSRRQRSGKASIHREQGGQLPLLL